MILAIVILIVFVILVIEIPFELFVNISLDRVLLEYMVESPIKSHGYAYLKNGELFHGNAKKESEGGVDTVEFLKKARGKIIVKSLHIRGMLGEENIENSMIQCVLFQNIANGILGFVKNGNKFATLSESYQIDPQEDSNIFIQTTFWFSVLDLLSLGVWWIINKLIKKGEDRWNLKTK